MFKLKNGVTLLCDDDFMIAAHKLKEYFSLFYGIDIQKAKSNADISLIKTDMENECFSINVENSRIMIHAGDIKGAIYATSTLIQLIDAENLSIAETSITDGPYKPIRGIHMFLPARENIVEYKRIFDVLVFFKINTVIIEVGGGMQYDKHPEINKCWEQFTDIADNKFPGVGKSRSIQKSDIYRKDAIHTELAGGSFLTKSEVSDIVEYAKSTGITVIPEIQALSHSYYLTLAHKEIAELKDDMFPDTYCPLNEQSYELYFDVAKEIIDVFKPKFVSIGHDEVRVLGQCEKCRQKTGHELLAYEINRLHNFYEKQGIKIFMWGEMLQCYRNYKGEMMGLGLDIISAYGLRYTLPQTYKAKYSIPKDITMLDWHYMLSHDSEKRFAEDGFRSVFGNFRGSTILNWKERSKSENLLGAEVSTWCVSDEKTFARDGIFFELMFSANILWDKEYNDEKYKEMADKVTKEMCITRALMRQEQSNILKNSKSTVIYKSSEEKAFATFCVNKSTSVCNAVKKVMAGFGDTMYGTPINSKNILIKKDFYADSILFFHSAKTDMPFAPSHMYPDDSSLGLGTYAILYEDGSVDLANIIYGTSVGPLDFELKLGDGSTEDLSFEIDDDTGENNGSVATPTFSHKSPWAGSIVYGTTPVFDGDKAMFAYEWKNPRPHKKIIKIKAINTCHDKEQGALLFGIAAIKITDNN